MKRTLSLLLAVILCLSLLPMGVLADKELTEAPAEAAEEIAESVEEEAPAEPEPEPEPAPEPEEDPGAMRKSGWLQSGSSWYYFKADGKMAAGETLSIDGKNYTFNSRGVWAS